MIERLNPQLDSVQEEERKAQRAENHREFTGDNVRKLPLPTTGQLVYWDTKQVGLSVLCSMSTRTYRASYVISHDKDHENAGKAITRKIGRVGEMTVQQARKTVESYRGIANRGDDPAKPKPRGLTFGEVADKFVKLYCKANQRTWHQSERILKNNCEPLWNRPIDMVSKQRIKELCSGFAAEGYPYKASVTHATVKKMLGWAEEEGLIKSNVLLGSTASYERRTRNRVFSDDEIKLIWKAADQLDPAEGAYVKLLLLLAPRKTALACMRHSHLDNADEPTLWTTPHQLTKSSKRRRNSDEPRVYQTPLPALARRIIKGLPKDESGGLDPRLFPKFKITINKGGQPEFITSHLIERLAKHGAPKDFYPHAVRHTLSTWLKAKGASLWERGLVLNHAEAGVTAGYSHDSLGITPRLKLELLEKWAAHIEQLVSPAQSVTLR
jgi:integrase